MAYIKNEPPIDFHPYKPDDYNNPWPKLAVLRRECPIADLQWGDFLPIKFLTRYDDCCAVLRSWQNFVVGGRVFPGDSPELPPEERTVVNLVPPHHPPMRRIYMSSTSPRSVDGLRSYIEALCEEAIDAFASRGTADLFAEWAVEIPSTVTAHLIGVPDDDHLLFREWTEKSLAQGPETRGRNRTKSVYHNAFQGYVQRQIELRRAGDQSQDDFIADLLTMEAYEGKLSDVQIRGQVQFLLVAGNETTTSLMGNMAHKLLKDPELYDRVRADRTLVPMMVEETLRHEPPLLWPLARRCVNDTVVGDTPIEAGETLILSAASGNRDESVWGPDAEEFVVDRKHPVKVLSFGMGPHVCVGAPLARVVAAMSLNHLLDRFPRLELAPDFEWERNDFPVIWSPKRLDVVFEPAHA